MKSAPVKQTQAVGTWKATYPEYKPCLQTWLPDIPARWRLKRVKHEYSVTLGKMLQSSPASPHDILLPYLRSANVTWGGVDVSDVKEMYFSPTEAKQLRLEEDDVVVCEGGDVGRAATWKAQIPETCIQNAVHRVRTKGRSLNRFLYYWLFMAKESGFIDVLVERATIGHLTEEKLREVPFYCPPKREQEQIVSFLNRETAKADALIAKRQQLIALLEEKRAALISRAVTKGLDPSVPMKDSGVEWLGKIPAHWSIRRLRHITDGITVGVVVNPSSYVSDEGVPFLLGGDIHEFYIDTSNCNRCTPETSSGPLRKSQLSAGDVVVVRVGYPGVAAVVPPELQDANCASMIVARKHRRFFSQWLACVINSQVGRDQIDIVQYGAAQKQFNISHAMDFSFPFPPLEEQRSIADYLDHERAKIEVLMDKIREGGERLKEYRTALISAAVTGKIDVRGKCSD